MGDSLTSETNFHHILDSCFPVDLDLSHVEGDCANCSPTAGLNHKKNVVCFSRETVVN